MRILVDCLAGLTVFSSVTGFSYILIIDCFFTGVDSASLLVTSLFLVPVHRFIMMRGMPSIGGGISMRVCGITALHKLQTLQNRAARIVTNSPYNASALPIVSKLGWQTVNDLIAKETLKMVYKCTNDEAPSYLACLFDRLSETSTRELRNTETDLRVLFLRTTCGQKCFSFRGAKLWNGLDAKSKLTKNFKQFKSCLENSRI